MLSAGQEHPHVPCQRSFFPRGLPACPSAGSQAGCIWLLVNEDGCLEQMIRQMRTVQDVHDGRLRPAVVDVFAQLGHVMPASEQGRSFRPWAGSGIVWGLDPKSGMNYQGYRIASEVTVMALLPTGPGEQSIFFFRALDPV